MAYRRLGEDIKILDHRLKVLLAQRESVRVISDGVDSPFWKTFKQLQKEKLQNIERGLDNFEKISNDDIRLLLTQRKLIKLFISTPDDFLTDSVLLDTQIQELKQRIDERKQKLSKD